MSLPRVLSIIWVMSVLSSGKSLPLGGDISVLVIRVSFLQDSDVSTTGDGLFLLEPYAGECGSYVLDPPPHNRTYFEAHLQALDNYFSSVSREQLSINLDQSLVLPFEESASYSLNSSMSYYNPYGETELQEQRIVELFQDALEEAYAREGSIDYDVYDLITIVHAGIGQDFALPFLDPTPEDISSAYIDSDILMEQLGVGQIDFENGSSVDNGIILPETQNHLLFEESEEIFLGSSDPCEYQFALTGTWALMTGFAIGLPPLWDTETGESGAGVFSLMDQGSNNGRGAIPAPPDAWSRIYAGWEHSTTVRPTTDVNLAARSLANNQIVRVDIGGSEYFLIENRNNWLRHHVDIDSLRFRNWDEDNLFVKLLFDSIGAVIDEETGVIISVPNYDYGLPNSGLLIWHVDEELITTGLQDYTVNINREQRGIDLEEADGAQDIGYPSLNPFFDPGSGIWSDMWYAGNSQYYYANPGFLGQPMSFGPDTYPDTRSNSGADSYITIDNISSAGDTMRFAIANTLLADGFPDTSLNIDFFFDFTGDGIPEIIGGEDSLWWSSGDSLSQTIFISLNSKIFELIVLGYETGSPKLGIIENRGDSLKVSVYYFDLSEESFVFDWSQKVHIDEFDLVRGLADSDAIDFSSGCSGLLVTESDVSTYIISDCIPYSPSLTINGIVRDTVQGVTASIYASIDTSKRLVINEIPVQYDGSDSLIYLSLVDLDIDGRLEVIASTQKGSVLVYNSNSTLEAGFPVTLNATSPILSLDLFDDSHPELVFQVDSSDIVVLDWRGREQFRLSNPNGSKLRMLSQYQGKNCIATASSIWLFDEVTESHGNEWVSFHGDPSNSRYVNTWIDYQSPNKNRLINPRRTYNYPNPATAGTTTIRVFVESAEKVEVEIFDLAGYFVERLKFDNLIQGEVNEVVWNVSAVESGVYFANVKASKGSDWESKIVKIAVVH